MYSVSKNDKNDKKDINLKSVFHVIDEKEILNENQIKLAHFMSEKYITNLSYCLNCVLPPGDWSKVQEFFYS